VANRFLNQFRKAFEKEVVDIFGKVAIGVTGAPVLNVAQSKGIASIARTGVGAYTVTLSDRWSRLLKAVPTHILAAGVPATTSNAQMVVRQDNSGAAAKTILIEFVNNAGVAVELTNATSLLLQFTLKNSSV
jgi:hypothetical protein